MEFKIRSFKVFVRFFGGNSRFGVSKFSSDFSEGIQDSEFQSFPSIFRRKFKIRSFKVFLRFFGGNSRFGVSKFSSDFSEEIQDSEFQSFPPKNRRKTLKLRILNSLRKIGGKL